MTLDQAKEVLKKWLGCQDSTEQFCNSFEKNEKGACGDCPYATDAKAEYDAAKVILAELDGR